MALRTTVAALAALLLAGCAHVKPARMTLPDALVADGAPLEELPLQGVGGKARGEFRLGPVGGRFERSASRLELFDATVNLDRASVRYSLGDLEAACRARRNELQRGALALPLRPYLSNSLAPDRRLGLTIDNNWGPARVIVGLYESARTFAAYPQSTVLLMARGALEPLGPVGRSISTLADDSYWRRRARVAINLSILFDWAPRGDAPLGFVIGGDLPFKYGPLGLVVEYLYARSAPFEDPSVPPGLRADRQGLWAQAALMVLRPYLELEGRYEWFDVKADERQRFHALTAGLTGYVLSDRIKAQVAYGRKFHYAGPALRDDYLLLLLQIVD